MIPVECRLSAHIRLSAGCYLVYTRKSYAVAVSIFQMLVQPCVIYRVLIDLPGRQERLRIFSVYIISVDIDIVERIVLLDALCLIVERLRRFIIIYSYVRYRLICCCLYLLRSDHCSLRTPFYLHRLVRMQSEYILCFFPDTCFLC